jgi:hypothetical protein
MTPATTPWLLPPANMPITRELILKQKAEYSEAYHRAMELANANMGAMQALDVLLAELDKPSPEAGGSDTPHQEVV